MSETKEYVRVDIVQAEPMTLGKYNEFKGWTIPADEDPNRNGHLVYQLDNSSTWISKELFETSAEPTDGMTFGVAIDALHLDQKVCRAGWNGKGMYLFLVKGSEWTFTNGKNDNHPLLPFIAMKTATGEVVPWLASQTDVLARDWQFAK